MDEPQQWSVSASGGWPNEDAVFVSGGVAVVVDGAGLPQSMRAGCHHSVDWYSKKLARGFGTALLDTGLTMRQSLSRAITEVSQLHDGCDLAAGSPCATAAAWRLQPPLVEYLVLCDASVLVALREEAVEITDDRLSTLMAEQMGPSATAGETTRSVSEIRQARAEILQRSRNVDGGYWCCQTDPVAASHALSGTYPLSDVLGIVIATDGATRGFQSLQAHSMQDFVRRAVSGDGAALVDEVRAAERGQRQKLRDDAIKVHDDATLVTLAFADHG